MYLPNTFIIGAMKSGSTSLHNYLQQHPDIFMSERKEINYFIEEINYPKGIDWYRSHFIKNSKVRGESSIGYTKRHQFKDIPERIFTTCGSKLKFIYILRDPIERAVSHFIDKMLYMQKDSKAYPDINESLCRPANIYIETSRYYFQLEAYLNYFDITDFHFLSFEELRNDPISTLNGVCQFLDVSPIYKENIEFKVNNKTENKALKTEQAKLLLNNPFSVLLKSLIPVVLRGKVVQNPLYKKISTKGIDKSQYQLKAATLDFLNEYFQEDVSLLKQITAREFNEWKTYTNKT